MSAGWRGPVPPASVAASAPASAPGPIKKPSPIETDVAAERKAALDARNEAARQLVQTEARAEHRLEAARKKQVAKLSGIQAERDAASHQLQREARVFETAGTDHAALGETYVSEADAAIHERRTVEAQNIGDRDVALDTIRNTRQLMDERLHAVGADLEEVSAKTCREIEDAEAACSNELTTQQSLREDVLAKHGAAVALGGQTAAAICAADHAAGDSAVHKAEGARHRAAMMAEAAAAKAQATRTQAQMHVKLYEEKCKASVQALAVAKHQHEARTDKTLQQQLASSHVALEGAHDYCADVRRAMSEEQDRYKTRMKQLEEEAKWNAMDIQTTIHSLEVQRVVEFEDSQRGVEELHEYFRQRREACEEELRLVEQRLKEVEMETRERANQILKSWIEGNNHAEEAVKRTEQRCLSVIESMQERVRGDLSTCAAKAKSVQDNSVATAKSLQEQVIAITDDSRPSMEIARQEHEAAAARALETFKELRFEPRGLQAAADTAIAACMGQAEEEERLLEEAARGRIEDAKRRMRTAHEEEQAMQEETAEACSRLRAGCYKLRLANLHDLAQRATSGEFDAQVLTIPDSFDGRETWTSVR